ncbi:hypothetical protein GQR58_012770 [Nymphon striatum]|nr:hypothetical protein GQR58_012770 [Nymphon striatum]
MASDVILATSVLFYGIPVEIPSDNCSDSDFIMAIHFCTNVTCQHFESFLPCDHKGKNFIDITSAVRGQQSMKLYSFGYKFHKNSQALRQYEYKIKKLPSTFSQHYGTDGMKYFHLYADSWRKLKKYFWYKEIYKSLCYTNMIGYFQLLVLMSCSGQAMLESQNDRKEKKIGTPSKTFLSVVFLYFGDLPSFPTLNFSPTHLPAPHKLYKDKISSEHFLKILKFKSKDKFTYGGYEGNENNFETIMSVKTN